MPDRINLLESAIQTSTQILDGDGADHPEPVNVRGPEVIPIDPEPGHKYPDAAIKGFRWSFPDEVVLAEGTVVQLVVVARIQGLRLVSGEPRWNVEVLEVGEASE